MIFLGIESSGNIASVALVNEDCIIGEMTFKTSKNHSIILAPMVDDILKYCNLTLKDIDGIGVNVGPGSFTGIRIGVSLAAALAYGSDLPLVQVSSLESLSYGIDGIPIIHGRKNEYYVSYDGREEVVILDDFLEKIDNELIFIGNEKINSKLGKHKFIIREFTGINVARAAMDIYKKGSSFSPLDVKANYLRRPEVDINLEKCK